MLKMLALGALILLSLPLGLVALVLLPLVAIGLLLKLLLALLILPFRLLGAAIGLAAGLIGFLVKGFVALVAIGLGVALFAGGALAFVVVPIALLALVVWVVFKLLVVGAAAVA